MRLGAPVFIKTDNPREWAEAVRQKGYRAAYCPIGADSAPQVVSAYAAAAQEEDLVIAEVGAWSNPLASDAAEREKAIAHCQQQLALADAIGAVCCVNIAGSRGTLWDGPHAENFSDETFEMIVWVVRTIIDAVKPRRAFYTLEPMPWIFPDSPESYLDLIRAIDRTQFAAHLDPVNWINSPRRYFHNAAFLKECFSMLGPYIKAVHAKDILLSDQLTTHLDEVRPGLGFLDYRVFLTEMSRLPADTPIMLEHLRLEEEYDASAAYVRSTAQALGITL
jgi:sugar phosphate isomerase/epimerase